MRLDVPRTVSEVARLAEMDPQRMRRHLLRLHKQSEGQLLKRVGRQWMVTLASLRTVWPEFGKQLASNDDIRDNAMEHAEFRQDMRAVLAAMRSFRATSNGWFKRIEALEKAVGIQPTSSEEAK